MTSDTLDLLLSLLTAAVAMGLSHYAALALPGLAAHLGLISMPQPLAGLAAPTVWSVLLILLLLEIFLARYRLPDLLWSALHTLVRPAASLIFASAALHDTLGRAVWPLAAAAFVVALAVHISTLAVHAAAWTAGPKLRVRPFTLVQVGAAGMLATLAWTAPPYAASLAAVALLGPLPWWPRLWGAASVPLRALFHLLQRPGQPRAWRFASQRMPRQVRRALGSRRDRSTGPVRTAPLTVARLGPAWPYLRAWLVVAHGKPPLLMLRRAFRWQTISLATGAGRLDDRPLVETLELAADSGPACALCVGPEAPPAAAILAALQEA